MPHFTSCPPPPLVNPSTALDSNPPPAPLSSRTLYIPAHKTFALVLQPLPPLVSAPPPGHAPPPLPRSDTSTGDAVSHALPGKGLSGTNCQ